MVAFGIVVIVVCVASAVIATVMFVRAARLYDQIGRLGSHWLTHDDELSAPARELLQREVHEMMDAISAARERREQEPLSADPGGRR